MKKILIFIISGLLWSVIYISAARAFSTQIDADQVIENNGNYWSNPASCYQDDTLYASVLGSANGIRYLRAGLGDPALDTTNLKITGVTLYIKAYSSYSKSKIRIQPYFNNVAGTESGNLNVGITEGLRSFDITGQRTWTWQELRNLSFRVTPRTAAYFYVNHVFAVVNYTDSTILGDYSFQISSISSPETLGYYFPITIVARDSMGDTVKSFNSSAALSDSTGTISPITAQFVSGVCNMSVMIGENTALTAITVSDGDTFAVSNGFAVFSGLHHFWISPIASPQNVSLPFAVNISACDYNGDTITTFNEKAGLYDKTGTLMQDSTGNFTSGVWNGNITIAGGSGTSDTLWAVKTKIVHTSRGKSNGFLLSTPSAVELSWMTASIENGSIMVKWRTESELGNDRWIVERSTDPADGYVQLGALNGQGNTNQATEYIFADEQEKPEGLYYYRLIESDESGDTRIHGPVSAYWLPVFSTGTSEMRTYPNPSTLGKVFIELSLASSQRVSLNIYNIKGELVKKITEQLFAAGRHQLVWNGRNENGAMVSSGVYLLKAAGGGIRITRRVALIK